MKASEEHPILMAVATTIADGLPVDWETLVEAHPEIAEDLKTLRVLQEVEKTRRRMAFEEESGG